MSIIDYKTERHNDVNKIRDSAHPRKVVVAGPGTGKSYLFSELIKKKISEGKTNFLAITFIGKLGDALADDLCGLARTTTMHGFARGFVLEHCKGWNYYPRMQELIGEDLKAEKIKDFEIGNENYENKTKYYQAIGDADVVHYAVQICKKDSNKIPVFDLVLIDEYQDFNSVESEFVDLLAQKNEIVIVGDDDQALYAFKGSSPRFIRNKHDSSNNLFESHTLRFCSRCTEIIIKYFHALVDKFNLNNSTETDPEKKRIKKEYVCYLPDKDGDSKANSKLHLIKNCPVGMIAYKIRSELEDLAKNQKIKDILVIGEGRSCEALLKTVAQQLKNYGFKYVDYRGDKSVLRLQQSIVDGYKFLAKNNTSLLGWRILRNPTEEKEKEQHIKNAKTLASIIEGTPSKLEKIKEDDIRALEGEIENWKAGEKGTKSNGAVNDKTLVDRNMQNEKIRRDVLIQELKRGNLHLSRPLCNLDITVCNILNSKGVGADIVFLIGFDQGKFPSKTKAAENEIYQMLVAITRAKKRIYMINTVGKRVSGFVECLTPADWEIETINNNNN